MWVPSEHAVRWYNKRRIAAAWQKWAAKGDKVTVCEICDRKDPGFYSTAQFCEEAPPVPVCGLECEAVYLHAHGLEVEVADTELARGADAFVRRRLAKRMRVEGTTLGHVGL